MSRIGGNDTFVATQKRIYYGRVGLRTAGQEENVRIGATCGGTNLLPGTSAERIIAVTGLLVKVGFGEPSED